MKSLIENFSNLDDNSKKKLKLFGIGLIAIIILIIVISIIVAIINRKTSYEDMEVIMEKAAYDYYQNNLSQLPTESVKTSVVSAQTLTDQEYMKSIEKYTKDSSCTGNVVVTYVNGDFDYQGYLTCSSFVTSLLNEKIKKDNAIVTTGAGLYDEEGTLRFRGERVNNYLKVNDQLYRIIKLDSNGNIYITPQDMDDMDETLYVYWDDRYNSEEKSNCGINDFSLSRIKDSLETIYNNLDKDLKLKTVNFNACVANRDSKDVNNTGAIECSKVIENSKISLIPVYEYMKASISPACATPSSRECKNYNYLYNDDMSWWTNTGDTANTDKIYAVNYNGEIERERGNSRKLARYVVALKDNTVLNKGNGTESKPYTIR